MRKLPKQVLPSGSPVLSQLVAGSGFVPPSAANPEDDNSDVSDADGDLDDQDQDADDLEAKCGLGRKPNNRIAANVLAEIRTHGSALQFVRVSFWKQTRNKKECESLAHAIDALLCEGLKHSSLGLEILLRRLAGVQLADSTGSWDLCSAVEWINSNSSLLPREELAKVIREAERLGRLTRKTTSSSKFKSGNYNNNNNYNNSPNGKRNKFQKSRSVQPNAKKQSKAADGAEE